MRSTTSFQPGDLLLVAFPFAGSAQLKRRPALVILDAGDLDVVLARVTTQIHRTDYDVVIRDWRGAGLLAPSVVRTHKLATIEKALIGRVLGHLPPTDRRRVETVIRRTYGAW